MEVNVGDYTPTDGCPFPFQTSNLPETFINRPRPPRPTRRSDRQNDARACLWPDRLAVPV